MLFQIYMLASNYSVYYVMPLKSLTTGAVVIEYSYLPNKCTHLRISSWLTHLICSIEKQGEGKGEFGVNLSVLGGGQLLIITVYPT